MIMSKNKNLRNEAFNEKTHYFFTFTKIKGK